MSGRFRTGLAAGAALATVFVAGCHKEPSGQVVATVNGQEITLPELNAEAQAANVPDNADKKLVMPALLQRVIDRKLLADEARKRKLDKQSDYLVERRRADETLLAQSLLKPQLQSAPVPSPGDVSKFIAGNPTLFSGRARLTIDQIRFARPADVSKLKALESAHNQTAVAQTLGQLGIQFERGQTGLDSGTVPPKLMQQIDALPPGEPFVLPVGNTITVNVVTNRQAVAVPDADAKQMAANLLRQQNSQKAVADQIKSLRDAAKIQYQPGFAPPAGAGGGALGAGGAAPGGAAAGGTAPAAR